jgi:plasmid maintenance system antidote protein VapI/deoxycytidine triphosphate deaminase
MPIEPSDFVLKPGTAPKTPAEYLRQEMQVRELSVIKLANILEVHPQTLYNVTGKEPRPISSKLALKLSKHFGKPIEFWLSEKVPPLLELAANPEPEPRKTSTAAGAPLLDSGIMLDRDMHELLAAPGSGLSVTPFDPARIEAASFDLTMGLFISEGFEMLNTFEWGLVCKSKLDPQTLRSDQQEALKIALDDYSQDIEFTTTYELEPLKSVVIMSREELRFGSNFLADLGGTGRNAKRGLMTNIGLQVDPGYHGYIFVTALNMTGGTLKLEAGDTLASMAIKRLPRAPDQAYRQDIASAIARVAERVGEAVASIFAFSEQGAGERYKASFVRGGYEKKFLKSEDSDPTVRAVTWAYHVLKNGDGEERSLVEKAVLEALDPVPVSKEETKLIGGSFMVDEDKLKAVLKRFDDAKAHSLVDALGWLGVPPIAGAVTLLVESELVSSVG